jgi:hypothetical protein
MKVKIGPYREWVGPYQLAEMLCCWYPTQKDEYGLPKKADWIYNFGEWLAHGSIEPESNIGDITSIFKDRPVTWLYKFLKWVDSKKKRTAKIHIDKWDTWSMDYTLSLIVLPMLKQLKETKHGAPLVDDEDVPEHLRSTTAPAKENEWDIDGNHFKRWDWVIDEMIFAFECKASVEDWDLQFWTGVCDHQFKKLENGCSEMIKGPNHTAIYDTEGATKFHARIKNGLILFGKYYEGLWD